MNELKPCPFCGGEAKTVNADGSKPFATGCGSCSIWFYGFTKEEADAKWNTRADGWHPASEPPNNDLPVEVTDGLNRAYGAFIGFWTCGWIKPDRITHYRELSPLPSKEEKCQAK